MLLPLVVVLLSTICTLQLVTMLVPLVASSYCRRNPLLGLQQLRSLRMSSSALHTSSGDEGHVFTTYNVLSSSLGSDSYYTSCNPEHLNSNYRLKLLKSKLEEEISRESIIALQELSHAWVNELHPFLLSKNYYLITGLYGNKFNGYMGVGIALPINKYDLVSVDIKRVADTKRFKRSSSKSSSVSGGNGMMARLSGLVANKISSALSRLGLKKSRVAFWDSVMSRHNQMVCVRVVDKHSKQSLVVGAYILHDTYFPSHQHACIYMIVVSYLFRYLPHAMHVQATLR